MSRRTTPAAACRACLLAIAGLIVTIAPSHVLAHGVQHGVSEGATVVTATYDDGSPMAFCDVTVLAPESDEECYQEGTSDRNGCFAFLPDTNGIWKVTVDDGLGHMVKARIEVGSIGRGKTETAAPPDRLGGAVVGISTVFGVFGLYAMFAARGRRREEGREREA